jgi:hypothetical protein
VLRRFDEDRGSINRHLPQVGLTDDVRRSFHIHFGMPIWQLFRREGSRALGFLFLQIAPRGGTRARIAVPDINVTVIDDRQ